MKAKADDPLALKGNQALMREEVAEYLCWGREEAFRGLPQSHAGMTEKDRG